MDNNNMVLMLKKPNLQISTYQKILLYLQEEKLSKDKSIKASMGITEIGIANNLKISLSTASRTLRKLVKNREVEESKRYINGLSRQILVFFLTSKGLNKKKELEDKLAKQNTLLKGKDGKLNEVELSKVDYYLRTQTTMFEKIISISKEGVLDYKVLKQNVKKYRKPVTKIIVNITEHIHTLEYFYGREKELEQLKKWVTSKKPKIITVYGFAGIGKTILISKLISEYEGKKNTFWYSIHEWNKIKDVLKSLSEFLVQIGKKKLKNYLKSKETLSFNDVMHILESDLKDVSALLVFDNCEKADKELIQLFSMLKEIVNDIKKITLILISRSKLPFYKFAEVKIEKSIVEMELGDLDKISSIEYLRYSGVDESLFEEIYKILKGHPLALELIVTRIRRNLKNEVEKELNTNGLITDVVTFIEEDVLSYLSEKEREAMKIASVFRLPIPIDALLIDNKVDYSTIKSLSKSYLMHKTLGGDYIIHDLIKNYFYKRLTLNKKKQYHLRAATYYVQKKDINSLLETLYHYLKGEEYEKLADLFVRKGNELIKEGWSENLEMYLKEFLEKDIPKQYLDKILLLNGRINSILGNWDKAMEFYNHCIEIEKQDTLNKSRAFKGIGYICTERGEWDKAIENYEKSLKISEKLNDKKEISDVYWSLGNVYWKKSDYEKALNQLHKSLGIAKEIGDIGQIGKASLDIGIIELKRKNYEKSLKYIKVSLELLEKIKNQIQITRALSNLGILYYTQDNWKKALEYFQKCMKICKKIGNVQQEGYGCLNLGGCYIEIKDFKKAKNYINEALQIFEKLENKRMANACIMEHGKILRLQKNYKKSLEYLTNSSKIFEELEDFFYLLRVNYEIGMLYKDMEKKEKANIFFKKGLEIAKEKDFRVYIKKIRKEM